MEFINFIKTGFYHVAPILLAGLFGVMIIVERAYSLYVSYPLRNPEAFFEKISALVMSGKQSEAIAACDRYKEKPIAKIVKTALTRSHLPEGLIQDGIHLTLSKCTQTLLKRTSFLATIANVATLLGLFGTIAGLIQSFEAVGHADAQQKSALLSAGIATAMNATMLGLGVAIPCMIAFSILMNRSNRLIAELEQSSIQIVDILKQRFYSSEFHAASTEGTSEKSKKSSSHRKAA
jgi:biopolymer transport protein ExbB